ncbi:hybrid sensor histidine kinase/response regulator [Dendronalium sp. ChiSLP03b]|uniref:hybrid sensor histidine kinase/response regulator n=1 Tax=Dendronalium sp. ChiSLP03b TaxID=3075381 RepID=UPI002AD5ACC6|nr:hybrid sensor histidine kinase/response regulator [Dendronalium sp. ChiSLP03b]MDZ8208103.1 hybrid sensor histidine kinase/response regulator [Dendronalium sp. ChiSLP03b]
MITDAEIREQGYIYFLAEAPELVQTIEQELFSLSEGYNITKIHNMMRATHTIKGGAATVGIELIQTISHSLEDVFKALYNPNLVIDAELQTLLLQAYECLNLALTKELRISSINDEEIIQRATSVFAQMQAKLGDDFGADTHIPTSQELGFDIVQSIFEVGVEQRLKSLVETVSNPPDNANLLNFLVSQAEVFLGLAESLNLPGFGEIAKTILAALQANPAEVCQIAEVALTDLQQAQKEVLAGDRTSGGTPSPALQKLAIVASVESHADSYDTPATTNIKPAFVSIGEEFCRFLTASGNTKNERIKPTTAKLYLKVIQYILGWFNHQMEVPESELALTLLISNNHEETQFSYIENWLGKFLDFVRDEEDSYNLCLYRHGVILIILLAVAKFHYSAHKNDSNVILIQKLQNKISQLAKEYKKYPPVTAKEKNWLDNPKLKKLLFVKNISYSSDNLVEAIWGEEAYQNINEEIETNKITEKYQIKDYLKAVEPWSANENNIMNIPGSTIKINAQIEEQSQSVKSKKYRQNSFVRVDTEGLQRINYLAGELLIHQKRRTLHDEQIQEIIEQLLQRLNRHQETLNQLRDLPLQRQNFTLQYTQNFASVNFDSLEMDVYTEFNLTLHETIEETLQLQETTESLDLLLKQATQISDKKQSLAFSIIDNLVEARMLPLGNILNRFPQTIKNLSNVYHKLVELKLTGTGVLVDKAIAEKLYEPLLHLVRNAFDHGIESPQIRQESGKAKQGLIEIHAYHQGSQTIIEVRDDGQGLNLEKLRKKAIEIYHLQTEEKANIYAANLTESELLDLMFSPGFTTVDKVSKISGRGIGLDIVRSQMQALNGSVSVQFLPNQGTTFILKIPFSMTTDKLMLVQSGGIVYALLLDSIEKILIPSAQQIKEYEGKKVLHWNTDQDEAMVSMHHLSDLMYYHSSFFNSASLPSMPTTHDTEIMKSPVLLLRRNQGIFGLEIDQIIGEQELVIRPLGNAIAPPKYIYGCSSLANGNLILVIDGALLLESNEMQATLDITALPAAYSTKKNPLQISGYTAPSIPLLSASASTDTIEQPLIQSLEPYNKTPKVVLIVDDAISLRQTLCLTLQKSGYQVIQAQNGVEALEQLQQHPEIQVVISDLEMPRMNGFELLGNLRQNPNFVKIPVIILTSRSADKHRQLAQELGVQAYLTKPYLEHEFLSTVESLVNKNVNNLTTLVMTKTQF